MPDFENSKSKEAKPQSVSAKQLDKAQLISRLNEIYPDFNTSAIVDKNGNLIKHERDDYEKLIAKLADNFGENKLNDAELLSVVAHSANLIRFEDEPEFNKSIDAAETLFKEMGGKMFPKINPNNCNFNDVINFVEFTDSVIRKSSGFLILTDKDELNEMDNLRRNGNSELLLDKLKSLTQTITNHANNKFKGVNLPEEGYEGSAESTNEYKKIMPQLMEHLYKISLYRDKIEKQVKLDSEQKKIENIRQMINGGSQPETSATTPKESEQKEKDRSRLVDVESLMPKIENRVDDYFKMFKAEKDPKKKAFLEKRASSATDAFNFLLSSEDEFKKRNALEYIEEQIGQGEKDQQYAFEKNSKSSLDKAGRRLDMLKAAKDLIGRELSSLQLVDKKTDTSEKQSEKPKPEDDPELGATALRDKNYSLKEDGPFKALYAEHKTPAEVKSAVTPEIKRLFLKMMLKNIDGGIYGAEAFVLKNPGSVLNRKGVAHFSGIGVTVGYNAIVYQKIAVAAEGRFISPDEIAVMPMVDYLKRYLGYDLRADKKRAELLKKFTNALS